MVMRVMRWPLRPACCRKFSVSLRVVSLRGLPLGPDEESAAVRVDVKWKGSKGGTLGSRFRRNGKRARTSLQPLIEDGANWNVELQHECIFTEAKGAASYEPWEVCFSVRKSVSGLFRNGVCVQPMLTGQTDKKLTVAGTAVVDLADVASRAQLRQDDIVVPITCLHPFSDFKDASLVVAVSLTELRDQGVALDSAQPILPSVHLPHSHRTSSGDLSVSSHSDSKRGGVSSSEESSRWYVTQLKKFLYMLDSSHVSDLHNSSSEQSGSEPDSAAEEDMVYDEESMRYNTIADMNMVVQESLGSSSADDFERDSEPDENAALSQGLGPFDMLPSPLPVADVVDGDPAIELPASARGLLSWRKRKLSFRSPSSRGKPLLYKSVSGEEGGDDIDWDRRHSDPAIGDFSAWAGVLQNASEGEIGAADALKDRREVDMVGQWETKVLASRDGNAKIKSSVFFASFDQRSESAAGESACTVLVVVIADWLHRQSDRMPCRGEFDTLIREGSAEWRKLCDVDAYRERFPDRHFDLETIASANVRPLRVVPEKSFVGFFRPEGTAQSYDFLEGSMSFDDIWVEVVKAGPAVYIVSWNDHFFVLKVETNKCYIIDTLGERLYEGCTCAYMLQFNGSGRIVDVESTVDPVPISPSVSCTEAVDGADGESSGNDDGAVKEAADPVTKEAATDDASPPGKQQQTESISKESETPLGTAVCENGVSLNAAMGEDNKCQEEGQPTNCTSETVKEHEGGTSVEKRREGESVMSRLSASGECSREGSCKGRPLVPDPMVLGREVGVDRDGAGETGGSVGEECVDSVKANVEKDVVDETVVVERRATGDVEEDTECRGRDGNKNADGNQPEELRDVGKGVLEEECIDGVHGGMVECCQFVKKFFAAVPLRELETDLKLNLLGKVPLHQRLQIEFHFTEIVPHDPCNGQDFSGLHSTNLIVL